MSLLQNSNAISTGGAYNLESSLRFRSSASAYLSRTPTSTGDRQKFTVSLWVKRGDLGVTSRTLFQQREDVNSSQQFNIGFRSDDAIRIIDQNGGATVGYIDTNAVYRDTASWYHIVVVRDSTNATAGDRTKLYINGERVTSFLASSNVALNYSSSTNTTDRILIGCQRPNSSSTLGNFYDGYMTEFNLVDGQALTADDFGEYDDTTGVWKPKEYTGTYGTNGFYLPMKETQQATGFNTVLYTGNGGTQSISNVGFSPDLIWVKERSSTSGHQIADTVRGATKILSSDSTAAEITDSARFSSIDSDGFTQGANNGVNENNQTYVAWCWDAGSSTVSNTDGTITSSVRANPATGFSIATYTGNGVSEATVGHGLGSAPKVTIIKTRDSVNSWRFYTTAIDGSLDILYLNLTNAKSDISAINPPTSSVFSASNLTGDIVAYNFAEVSGYSKFGSYTGNGSTTGPTITTGFRPAFVMVKSSTLSPSQWTILDNTRSPSNPTDKVLYPNLSNAEADFDSIDFLDDGFQIKNTSGSNNSSGETYIYMAFADTRDAQFNFDASGNKNNWTANNINSNASSETTYDIMNDVATLTDEDTGNFATWNPLEHYSNNVDFDEANLEMTVPAGTYSNGTVATSTITMSSGKWYCEMTSLAARSLVGVVKVPRTNVLFPGQDSTGYAYYGLSGAKYNGSGAVTYGATYGVNDVMGVALDLDAGTLEFYKNGVSQGVAFTGLSGEFVFATGYGTTSETQNVKVNFGQRPFAYTPPTGYKKLNTYNLPDSTIADGSQYMNPVTYTGDGSTSHSITGLGFSPDLVWLKSRTSAVHWHVLFDTIRGANNYLSSNRTDAEATGNLMSSFDSDGFTVDATGAATNTNGDSYIAWNWRGSDSTAVSNTDGTITSTVSANTDSGFSVVTYTGTGANATVGHGLGNGITTSKGMIIIKRKDATSNWAVYHPDTSNANWYLQLNTPSAQIGDATVFRDNPTAGTIVLGTNSIVNASGGTYVAYCFADVEGFSTSGSYTGNGSTDGSFIYTGFKPAFVMVKRTDNTGEWLINDSSRDTYNPEISYLQPNLSSAEGILNPSLDFLSNGFKFRTTNANYNASGATYIYMAFAETPFKQSLAR